MRQLSLHPAARNLDDDCAVLEIGGETLVLTHDMMAEGVHFLPGQDPTDIAWKLVATNMSDLAAKGAKPVGVLLGYMLGPDDNRFIQGLTDALAYYQVPLLGGDTVSETRVQTIGLTAIGLATWTPVPSRSGAIAGDGVYLTGPVGKAMIAYEALQAGGSGKSTLAYRRPVALFDEGQALAPRVSAMMDVSDGLLIDASRIARASHVNIAIESARVPIGAPESRRADALRWGDDYQLLFTSGKADLPVPAARIGTVLAPEADQACGVILDGHKLSANDKLGYEHK